MRLLLRFRSPQFAQELLVRQNLAAVRREKAEESIFFDGQFQRYAVLCHHAFPKICFNRPKAQRARLRGLRASQEHAQARQQFACPKGLREIIICPRIKGGDFVLFLALYRQNQYRDLTPLSETAEHFQPGQIGQTEIENYDVRLAASDLRESESARLRLAYRVPSRLERDAK